MDISKYPFLHFQTLFMIPFWAFQIALEFYIETTAREDPNVLNRPFNSLILIYTFFGSWDGLALLMPAVFFAGKPSRRRDLRKWMQELTSCFAKEEKMVEGKK